MNGSVIPALIYYLVTFSPGAPAAPLQFVGPLDRAECRQIAREHAEAHCFAFPVRHWKPNK